MSLKKLWTNGINAIWLPKIWSQLASIAKVVKGIERDTRDVLMRQAHMLRRLASIEADLTHIRNAQRDHRNENAAERKLIAEALDRIESYTEPDLRSASWSVGTPVPE